MKIKNNTVENNSKIVGGDDNSINISINTDDGTIKASLPILSSEYCHRSEENLIIKKLNSLGVLCIYGISGLGKTSISIAIAHRLKEEYENILYIDGSKLKTTTNMNEIYIDKLGYKENLETTITRQKVLLIIDNMTEKVSEIVDKLNNMNLSESKVIITTQSNIYVDKTHSYQLKPLEKDICKKILLKNIEDNYEDIYINKILKIVSQNPLMIKILNRLLRGSVSLKDLCKEYEDIMNAEDIDSNQVISDRITSTFLKTCTNQIKIISWINSTYIDKELLKYMLGCVGFNNVESRGIFDEYNSINKYTIKIHDLILNAINHTVQLNQNECLLYENKIINYFKMLSETNVEENTYNNALYMHRDIIHKINLNNSKWGIEAYLFFKCNYSYKLDYKKWEEIDFTYLNECEYKQENHFEYMSVIEFFEKKLLFLKDIGKKEDINQFVIYCIKNIEKFLLNNTLGDETRLNLTHHLGKMYARNKEHEKAIDTFEYVVNKKSNYYSAKLQLIRLYERRKPNKSKKYVCEILDAYINEEQIDTTIVLATVQELRKETFKKELDKYILSDISKLTNLILSSSNFYFDLPFKVFVDMGRIFSYKYPETYKKIAKEIPIKLSSDIEDDSMLFNIGEFYKGFIKSNNWGSYDIKEDEQKHLISEAEKCYKKMKIYTDYQLSNIAGFYILAHMPENALEISKKIENKNDPFKYYYTSQAFQLIFRENKDKLNLNKALNNVEKAINISNENDKFKKYRSTFYREKGRILYLKENSDYIRYYNIAMEYADLDKFKKEIENELLNCINKNKLC